MQQFKHNVDKALLDFRALNAGSICVLELLL